jgi:ketosteroid isomerase-like protein
MEVNVTATQTLDQKSQALVEKDAIRDVIYRYCRAVDRCDLELMKACYWPDARDNHGFYSGNAHAFADYVIPVLQQALSTTHAISNVILELDGDRACGESYVHVTHRLVRPDGTLIDNKSNCRYIDLFERRSGQWKILFRAAVADTMYDETVVSYADPAALGPLLATAPRAVHGKGDPAYLGYDARALDKPDFAMADFWGAVVGRTT